MLRHLRGPDVGFCPSRHLGLARRFDRFHCKAEVGSALPAESGWWKCLPKARSRPQVIAPFGSRAIPGPAAGTGECSHGRAKTRRFCPAM